MAKLLNGGHKRRAPVTAADVRKVELDQALAFYKERFGDASDFVFVITGNVDLKKLEPLVLTYLASLPARGRKDRWKDLRVKHPKAAVERVVERGLEAKAAVQMVWQADDKWSREGARDLAILVEVLRMRLREILREDMGGVYGVRVTGNLSRQPRQRRTITIAFGCAPENVAALRKAVEDEIARLQKEGVATTYLDKIKAETRRGHEVELRTNDFWRNVLVDAGIHGDDPHLALDLEAYLARMTSDGVKAAALRFLPARRVVVGVMLPAAKPAAAPAPAPKK
jgi:zinc protease